MNLRYAIARWLMHRRPRALRDSKIDRQAKIGAASQVVRSTVGRYSYCGSSCTIIEAEIGNFVSIADNVMIGGARHAIEWVSTSPVFHDGRNPFRQVFSSRSAPAYTPTLIGSDVWIGRGAMIASGVTVGPGAVVGMGSIVTRDVAPYTVVVGAPAKAVRLRFDLKVAERLLAIRWWDWDEDTIRRHAGLFDDPQKLIEEVT